MTNDQEKDDLEVIVNDKHYTVPRDFGSTPEEFQNECGYTVKDWAVYRVGHLSEGDRVSPDDRCSEPMVVSDGDEFMLIPEHQVRD